MKKNLPENEIFDLRLMRSIRLTKLKESLKVLEESAKKQKEAVLEAYRKIYQEFGYAVKQNIGE